MKKFHIVMTLMVVLLFACSTSNTDNVLRVGLSADVPPFAFINAKGEYDGFDVELIRLIGQSMGKKIEFENIPFQDLLSSLNAKKIDIAISSITATQERKNMFTFTIPYLYDDIVAIYKKGGEYTSILAVKDAIIGVQKGTAMESWIRFITLSNIKSISFTSIDEGIQEVMNGKINIFLSDGISAQNIVTRNRNLDYFIVGTSPDGYAIAIRQGSPLEAQMNAIIQKLSQEGTLTRLKNKWFAQHSSAV